MFSYILVPWVKHIQRRTDLAASTKDSYARVARQLEAAQISVRDHVIDLGPYVKARLAAGCSVRTVQYELQVARIARLWAVRGGMLPATTDIRAPRLHADRQDWHINHSTPSPEHAAAAIAALRFDDWRLAIELLARTGARVGEVIALTGADLDEVQGTVTFGTHAGARKTGRRTFPLDAVSLRELGGRSRRGDQPLFDFAGMAGCPQEIGRRLRVACKRAGVPAFTAQGLRRMVVVRLLRAKVDPGVAATLTGHSVEVMLRYYQTVTDGDRREAATTAHLGALDLESEASKEPV